MIQAGPRGNNGELRIISVLNCDRDLAADAFLSFQTKKVENFLMQIPGLLEFCHGLFLPLGDLDPNTLGVSLLASGPLSWAGREGNAVLRLHTGGASGVGVAAVFLGGIEKAVCFL